MFRAAWPLCLAVVSTAGCFHDFDEPFSGGTAGGGESATGGGGAGATTNTGGDGAGASGGSGGSSMTGLPEDCANGADDDGDTLVDCDDVEDCPGFACIDHPGAGWEGPLFFYSGTPEGAPACPDGAAVVVEQGTTITTPPATCANCNCQSPQGGTCGAATFVLYSETNCMGTVLETITSTDELCHDQFIDASNQNSYRASAAPATGTCNPVGVQPNIQDATLSGRGLACDAGTGGTCGAGGVCANTGAMAPFEEDTLCFGRAGDQDCPEGLPNKHLLYESVTDERVCAPCECGPAMNRRCGGDFELNLQAGCAGNDVNVNLNGNCNPANDFFDPLSYRFDLQSPQNGTCTPSGGTVTGEVVTNGDYTVCCNGPSD